MPPKKSKLTLRMYEDNGQMHVRAQQVWVILVGCAMRRQNMTYGQLADLMGYGGATPAANAVFRVHAYCKHFELPLLNLLVVNKETGLPSGGLPKDCEIHEEVQRVFAEDWYAIRVPTTNAFRRSWEEFDSDE